MRPWGLPPHYAVYPVELLMRADVPNHLKITYLTLYALAWRNDHRTVLQSMAQLADVFSALEGKSLSERGMRKRMAELADLGLVRRAFSGGRWVTRLLLCHGEGEPSTGTGRATPELAGGTSILTDVDDTGIAIQHQQSYRCGPGSSPPEPPDPLRAELWSMGIGEPTAGELAQREHVTAEYLDDWAAFLGTEEAKGNHLGTGWLVKQIRAGRPAPRVRSKEHVKF